MIGLLLCVAHAAAPDEKRVPTIDLAEEAELRFRLGVEAYKSREYATALEHLLASNRLVPNRNVAFNLARSYEELGQLENAWRHYDQYVRSETDRAARTEGEVAIARLQPKIARVQVVSDPPGATVYLERIDLGARGQTPLTLALPAGTHEILVGLDGFRPASREVTVALGALAEVSVSLGKPAEPPVGAAWAGALVQTGLLHLVDLSPGKCVLMSDLEARYAPQHTLPAASGAALAVHQPPGGLVLELRTQAVGRTPTVLRTQLLPVSKKGLTLANPSPLHVAVFERCVPMPSDALTERLNGLPTVERRDAARFFAEWAAWRGAGNTLPEALACNKGDCAGLVAALLR